jgi:3D (Asp-Asp-Asp) domain-containing protein
MYWGNPNAGLPTYANDGSVWQDYFGVYHLEQTSGPAQDSSPLNNHLTALNTPVLESSGLAGTAYSTTDSANNGFLSNSLSGTNRAKEGTYTVWAKTPADPADNKSWLGLEYDSNNSLGFEFRANDASPPLARMFASGSTILSTPDDNVGTGNWQMLTLRVKDGYASAYVDGVLDGSTAWFHPGKNLITGTSLGRSITASGPNTTVDEATFSTVARSADWLSASFHNQKPNSTYVNFGSLVGPISLNDSTGTEIYGKKDSNITSFTIGHSGSGSFSATGLPPGLSINSATGVISGATSVVGSQNFTITATGTTAGGANVTVSKQYKIVISDPASFPFSLSLTIPASQLNSTLTDFPLLVSLSSSISGFSYNAFLDSDSDGIRTGGDLRFLPPMVRNFLMNLRIGTPQGYLGCGLKFQPSLAV